MVKIWGSIKSYASLLIGGLLTALVFLTKFWRGRAKKEKERADRNERMFERAKEIAEVDTEATRERDRRTEELADEIEKKRTSSEHSNPNAW